MTIWIPDLDLHGGPKYRAIADAILSDIRSGGLQPGERLPTHRDLAYRLGVTVGTVTRAYSEAERRGLVKGEVGRGTYIRDPNKRAASEHPELNFNLSVQNQWDSLQDNTIDFSLNLPASGLAESHLRKTLDAISRSNQLSALLSYAPDPGLPSHRAAGAAWITATTGMDVDADNVVVTNGAQHAMAAALMAVMLPGDTLLSECLTYPGLKTLAGDLGLNMIGVEMDEEGLRPDAFEAAAKQHAAKAIYTMPTLQNPTARTQSTERRKAIAEIARRYNVIIIEDDVMGALPLERPLPLSTFAPEISYYLTSLSKCVAPGLRLGYLVPPEGMHATVGAMVRDTCRMATPLMAEIGTQWIEKGIAEEVTKAQRNEIAARQRVVANILKGMDFELVEGAFHFLLFVPEPWRDEDLTLAVKEKGVLVLPMAAFAVGREAPKHALRICLGAARDVSEVEKGMTILSQIMRAGSVATNTVGISVV